MHIHMLSSRMGYSYVDFSGRHIATHIQDILLLCPAIPDDIAQVSLHGL